jgi:hypothetical protein
MLDMPLLLGARNVEFWWINHHIGQKDGRIILRRIFWKEVTRIEVGHDWLRIIFCHHRISCE